MTDHPLHAHPSASLFLPGKATSRRASSWDRSGANQDFLRIGPGETVTLMEAEGPGCITHVYCAMVLPAITEYRDAILRCYWDSNDQPSVETPLGDFFGLTHGRVRQFTSHMVTVNPGVGSTHGLNAYFPMPFTAGASITLENRGPSPLGGPLNAFWYHIDFETYDRAPVDDPHRFHASYRQERPTEPAVEPHNVTLHDAPNLDGVENYVALDTQGEGRMVGLVLEIDNHQGTWYGEGDDMVFIDGEVWPPSIHGTGSEEIFGGGACPAEEYAGPYTGFHLIESPSFDGLVGMYRWYVHDPIHFSASLRWTLEHGHANNFANDYTSVAYWYQTPAGQLPPLPGRDEMLPPLGDEHEEAKALLSTVVAGAMAARAEGAPPEVFLRVCRAGEPFYQGDFATAIDSLRALQKEA